MTNQICISSVDERGGIVGFAYVDDGEMTRNRTRVKADAFDKSLAKHSSLGTKPAMLLFHDLSRPVGTWHSVTRKANALEVRGTILRETSDGAEAYALCKAKAISMLSVGFIPIAHDKANQSIVTEADLLEVSLVPVGASPGARITVVNSITGPAEIEDIFKASGLSGRKAKIAASAAWRSIQTNDQAGAERLAAIMANANERLARFRS